MDLIKKLQDGLSHGKWKRALGVSMVVGTLLTLVNQGRACLTHGCEWVFCWSCLVNYAVPFLVAAYSQGAGSKDGGRHENG